MSKSILLIFEGEVDEVSLFKQIERVYFKNYNVEFNFYCYSSSIYELYDELSTTEYESILSIIKYKERNNPKELEIISQKFTDIFLIFDFDPHYQKYSNQKIENLLTYFNDSMDNGKLYINYPMSQSYKHFKSLPDNDYKDYYVYICDCSKYKEYVHNFSTKSDIRKYSFSDMNEIIKQNLRKCNFLLNNIYGDINKYEDYSKLNACRLLASQINFLNDEKISILNTSVFFAIDYTRDSKIFDLITRS